MADDPSYHDLDPGDHPPEPGEAAHTTSNPGRPRPDEPADADHADGAALQHRAGSFGANAELYDRTRPSYPLSLIEHLLTGQPQAILDVGCGTGKVSRLLRGAGRLVIGVEPDERMAAVAVAHGVEVETGAFETWDPGGRQFDLLVSGQAWHWVDPVAGAAKAAEVLRSGGRFAAFWNVMHHVPEVRSVFDVVYGRHAPALLTSSLALGAEATIDERIDIAAVALEAAPFRDVTEGRRVPYHWEADYTPADWIGLLRTHSDHEILGPAILQPLLIDLEAGLVRLGPTFPIEFATELLAATRV